MRFVGFLFRHAFWFPIYESYVCQSDLRSFFLLITSPITERLSVTLCTQAESSCAYVASSPVSPLFRRRFPFAIKRLHTISPRLSEICFVQRRHDVLTSSNKAFPSHGDIDSGSVQRNALHSFHPVSRPCTSTSKKVFVHIQEKAQCCPRPTQLVVNNSSLECQHTRNLKFYNIICPTYTVCKLIALPRRILRFLCATVYSLSHRIPPFSTTHPRNTNPCPHAPVNTRTEQ